MTARRALAGAVTLLTLAGWAQPSPQDATPLKLQPVLVLQASDFIGVQQFADGSGQALQRAIAAWLLERRIEARSARARSLALGLDEARSSSCVAVLTPRWAEFKVKPRRVELAIALEWTDLQREPLTRCEQRANAEVEAGTEPDLSKLINQAVDRCLAEVYTDSAAAVPTRPLLVVDRDLLESGSASDSAPTHGTDPLAELRQQLPDKQFVLLDGYDEYAGRGIARLDLYLTDGQALSVAVAISLDRVELTSRLRQRLRDRAQLELAQAWSRQELSASQIDISQIADSDPLDRVIEPIDVQLPQLTRLNTLATNPSGIWFWVEIDAAGRATRIVPLLERSETVEAVESELRQASFTPGQIDGKPAPLGRLILASSPE